MCQPYDTQTFHRPTPRQELSIRRHYALRTQMLMAIGSASLILGLPIAYTVPLLSLPTPISEAAAVAAFLAAWYFAAHVIWQHFSTQHQDYNEELIRRSDKDIKNEIQEKLRGRTSTVRLLVSLAALALLTEIIVTTIVFNAPLFLAILPLAAMALALLAALDELKSADENRHPLDYPECDSYLAAFAANCGVAYAILAVVV